MSEVLYLYSPINLNIGIESNIENNIDFYSPLNTDIDLESEVDLG